MRDPKLGVQNCWLGLLGGLWGLPRAASLWDGLGDTNVPEFPHRSGVPWWLSRAPRPPVKRRQGLPIATPGDTQHLPGYGPEHPQGAGGWG